MTEDLITFIALLSVACVAISLWVFASSENKWKIKLPHFIIIILVALGIIFSAVSGFLIYAENKNGQNNDYLDVIRNWLLALGGLGGIYGLSLAAKRTNNANEQLFNERLGRGVESLSNDKMIIRSSGVRVLADLAVTSSTVQKKLILDILYDYIKINPKTRKATKIRMNKNSNQVSVKIDKQRDAELAVQSIFDLHEQADVDAFYIDFTGLKLQGMNLRNLNLRGARFFNADLSASHFKKSNLNDAWFDDSDLIGVKFESTRLREARFHKANLFGASFLGVELYRADFDGADLSGVEFRGADLHGADFSSADLGHSAHMRPSQIELIIYDQANPPRRLPKDIKLPPDRAYNWKKVDREGASQRYFVNSLKPWRNKLVDKQIMREVAEVETDEPLRWYIRFKD